MRRFVEDESGMTMALAVMMIVLIGVMGAGLLIFVMRDLNAVVEVNAGQRAQGMANAGLEAAKYQLSIVDALPSSYDSVVTAGNSVWYDDGTGNSGKWLDIDSDGTNDVLVSIRYLLPSSNATEARDPNHAPEMRPTYYRGNPPVVDTCQDVNGDGIDDDFNPTGSPPDPDACGYENNRSYFRVTARGNTGSAVRAVQAIYQTENFSGAPLANYASRDISFSGNSWEVENMSLFAGRDIDNFEAERITGTDFAYGDWATIPGTNNEPNPYNATPRTDASGASVTRAGAAAPGTITYGTGGATSDTRQKAGTATPQRYGYRDYDTNTDVSTIPPTPRPEFAVNDWSPGAQPATKRLRQ